MHHELGGVDITQCGRVAKFIQTTNDAIAMVTYATTSDKEDILRHPVGSGDHLPFATRCIVRGFCEQHEPHR